ncbi:MAG TPA: VTT domain-containing protein [Bryobacteraceae bacterium]|nr:VTT domain-containing protein [Bryobacteraceae bacterium]
MKSLLAKIAAALVAYGPWGIFLIGFIDSVGVPLPAALDALLIFLAVKAPHRAYFAASMAVAGSLGGNLTLFLAARYGSRRFLKTVPEPSGPGRFRRWFRRYGLVTVFIPAMVPFVPLPLKVFVISAGALHTGRVRFVVVILVARIIRYFGEAYLGIRLGQGAEEFLVRNAWTLVGGALGTAAILYVIVRLNDRRRQRYNGT